MNKVQHVYSVSLIIIGLSFKKVFISNERLLIVAVVADWTH